MNGFLLLFGASFAIACSCVNTGTTCNTFTGTEAVFLGRVIRDSGEGLGKGPARMVVEEVLHGVSKELREVEVETSAGTSCYMRLAKDERYVIYGGLDPTQKNVIHRHACSFSFNVHGNERLLDGLRQAQNGGQPKLVGKVYTRTGQYDWEPNGPPGLTIVAEGQGIRQEAKTGSDGQFEICDLGPG